MPDKKICPLLCASALECPAAYACLKEACAWWVEDKQKCALCALGSKK